MMERLTSVLVRQESCHPVALRAHRELEGWADLDLPSRHGDAAWSARDMAQLSGITNAAQAVPARELNTVDPAADIARCFLRLANLPNFAFDRLSRYEATLWRQVTSIRKKTLVSCLL
jgi:hypothetical protein